MENTIMDFSSTRYAALLQRLLAPTWRERQAADRLLFSLLMGQECDSNGCRQGAIAEAIEHLGAECDTFLAALIAFWADTSGAEYQSRMAMGEHQVADAPPFSPGWATTASVHYPLRDHVQIIHFDMYGLGIDTLLSGIGPRAVGRVAQLAACLLHPEPTVKNAAIDALGSIGPGARPALPALLVDVRQRGYSARR